MVKDILPGQRIDQFFVLRKLKLRTQKVKNEQYLSLELGDASGRIFGTIWHHLESVQNSVHEGDLIKINAKVIDWKGRPHLSVEKIRLATEQDNVRLSDYIPKSETDSTDLYDELLRMIDNIKNSHYAELLRNIYLDPHIKPGLLKSPAGKLWHHCYSGGLLEHTLGVARITMHLATLYPQVDSELLQTAALLHDIGKIKELQPGTVIDYTDEGRLLGHVAIGYHLVAVQIDKVKGFPQENRNLLLHLLLSHQGQRENGSPVPPMTREALILYYADELDSKLNAFERVYNKEKKLGKRWSSFVKLMDRFFYFGPQKNEKNGNQNNQKT